MVMVVMEGSETRGSSWYESAASPSSQPSQPETASNAVHQVRNCQNMRSKREIEDIKCLTCKLGPSHRLASLNQSEMDSIHIDSQEKAPAPVSK